MADPRDVALIEGMAEFTLEQLAPLVRQIDGALATQDVILGRIQIVEDAPAPDLSPLQRSIDNLAELLAQAQRELNGELADVVAELASASAETGDWLQRMGERVDELSSALEPMREALSAAIDEHDRALAAMRDELAGSEDRLTSALNIAVAGLEESGAQATQALSEVVTRVEELEAAMAILRPSLDAAAEEYRRSLQQAIHEGTVGLQDRLLSTYADFAELQREMREFEPQPGEPGEPGPPGPPGSFADVEPYVPGRIYRAGEAVICHDGHPDRWAMAVAENETYEPPCADCPDWRVLALHGKAGEPGGPGDDGPAGPGFRFRGLFHAGIYSPGDVALAASGSLFVCERERVYTDCPQDGWRLFLKQGKRGPKGHDGAGIERIAYADGALQVVTTDHRSLVVRVFPDDAAPLLFRGTFVSTAHYARGDVVSHAGASYLATGSAQGLAPHLAPDVWLPMGGRV